MENKKNVSTSDIENVLEYITKKKTQKKKLEFSKILLIQEAVLIWVMTISFIVLAYLCIVHQYFSELPWLTTMVAFPWTAYGASQAFYYKKAEKENTKDGIKYETTMANLNSESNKE